MELIGKIEDFIPELFKLERDKKYKLEIKQFRNKRSLNANAYCWKLCTEIGNLIRLSKEEVYLTMLKNYGQSELVSVLSNVDVTGYFKYYEVAGTSYLNGKNFIHYKVFKGSSEYDTREMSILIDGIVQECTNLGIPTITDKELERLKGDWCCEVKNC